MLRFQQFILTESSAPPPPTETPEEKAKRETAERAEVAALKKQKEAEEAAIKAKKDAENFRTWQLERNKRESGYYGTGIGADVSRGAAFFSKGGGDYASKVLGGLGGLAWGGVKALGKAGISAGISAVKHFGPPIVKAAAAGTIAATKAAGRGVRAVGTGAANVARKIFSDYDHRVLQANLKNLRESNDSRKKGYSNVRVRLLKKFK